MSSFGTGSIDTTGTLTTISTFGGTNGVQAGSDGLVPGPAVNQDGYLLGAGGDWTLEVLGGIALNDSTDRIATTQFVQQVVGNAALGGNANLGALGDVNLNGLADSQFLQYNALATKWENVTLTLGVISDVNLAGLADGNTIVWNAVAGEWVPGAGGGGGGAADLDDLNDVAILNPIAGQLLVHNGAGDFVNRLISTADLSDNANIALLNAVQTFSGDVAFTADVDLTGAITDVVTQGAGNNSTRAASTAFVQQEITALNLGTASQNDAGDFLASNAGVGDLSNVTLGALAVNQLLVYTGAVNGFENQTISSAILTDSANIALLNANQTFTGTVEVVTQPANDNSTKIATTEYTDRQVSDSITALNLGTASQNDAGDFLASGSSVDDLADVTLGALAVNQLLVYTGAQNGFENQTISSSILTDSANVALLDANQTFTGTVEVVTQPANDNSTKIASTEYTDRQVSDSITALNLGTASQNDAGDFLASNAGVNDLSDVNTAGVVNGNVLTYNNGTWLPTAPAVTYTDEQARNASGTALANGVHNGVSFVNDDANDRINATVSLAGFSINDLSDVDTTNKADGRVLKFNAQGNLIVGDDTGKTDEEIEDIVGLMFTANNAGNSLITFSYDDTGGANDGTINATVSLASTDLTDTVNIARLNANNTFTADVDLTGANATTALKNAGDNTASLASTAFVQQEITGLNLGTASQSAVGDFLASGSGADDLSDITLGGVALAQGQVLRVSADNQTFVNAVLASTDLSDTANIALLDANNVFTGTVNLTGATATATTQANNDNSTNLATTEFVKNVIAQVGNVSDLNDLTDVTLGGLALAEGQILRVSADNQTFVNAVLASTDLSDTADLIRDTSSVGDLSNVNLAGIAEGNVLAWDAVNTEFVVSNPAEVAQDAVNDLLITNAPVHTGISFVYDDNANNMSATVSLSGFSVSALSDVDTAGVADAHILIYDGVNDNRWESVAVSGDVTISSTGVTAISAGVIVDADVSALASIAVSKLASSDVTIGSTSITLGNASTTLSGMTGIDFTNANATIGASMTTQPGGAATELTLGGGGSQVNVSGDLVVLGDMVVGGTTTTINTTNLDVADQIISLNNGVANANTTDIGLFLDRGTLNPALIFWDEGSDRFKMATHLGAVTSSTTDFTGAPGLTLAPLEVETPALADNSNLVATTAWVQGEINNLASDLDGLTDVTIGDIALAQGQVLRVSADNQTFVNAVLASTDLSDSADLIRDTSSVNDLSDVNTAGVADGDTLVWNAVNTAFEAASLAESAQDAINDLFITNAPVHTGISYAYDDVANTLTATVSLAGFSADDLSDIDLAGIVDGNVLTWDAGNAKFVAGDTTDLAQDAVNDLFITNAPAHTGISYVYNDVANTLTSTVSLSGFSVGDLSNVSLGGFAVGQVLRWDGNNFVNTALDYSDLANKPALGNSASLDTTITGGLADAGKVVITDAQGKLGTLDGTNLTGVLLEDQNLADLTNTGDARDNLGLGASAVLDTTIAGGLADAGKVVITDGQGALGALDGANLTALGDVNLHSNVDTAGIQDGQGLVYNANNQTFEPGSFAQNLPDMDDVSADAPVDGQILKYTTAVGANQNKYVPTTLGTASDVDTGIDAGEIPVISAQAISLNPNALVGGDLFIYGRVTEVIDYGSVAEALGAGDFSIDFGLITDTVIYSQEDYGVLVV